MRVVSKSSPFGSLARTRVLLSLELLGESYARELSRVFETSLSGIQRALQALERDGLVVGRAVGRTRVYQVNPRYPAVHELRRLLRRLAESDRELEGRLTRLRRRPRRAGKPL